MVQVGTGFCLKSTEGASVGVRERHGGEVIQAIVSLGVSSLVDRSGTALAC